MTPFRWSLVAVIALAAGGAGLHRALREPDAPALARPADVTVLPLALPGAEQAGAVALPRVQRARVEDDAAHRAEPQQLVR